MRSGLIGLVIDILSQEEVNYYNKYPGNDSCSLNVNNLFAVQIQVRYQMKTYDAI